MTGKRSQGAMLDGSCGAIRTLAPLKVIAGAGGMDHIRWMTLRTSLDDMSSMSPLHRRLASRWRAQFFSTDCSMVLRSLQLLHQIDQC